MTTGQVPGAVVGQLEQRLAPSCRNTAGFSVDPARVQEQCGRYLALPQELDQGRVVTRCRLARRRRRRSARSTAASCAGRAPLPARRTPSSPASACRTGPPPQPGSAPSLTEWTPPSSRTAAVLRAGRPGPSHRGGGGRARKRRHDPPSPGPPARTGQRPAATVSTARPRTRVLHHHLQADNDIWALRPGTLWLTTRHAWHSCASGSRVPVATKLRSERLPYKGWRPSGPPREHVDQVGHALATAPAGRRVYVGGGLRWIVPLALAGGPALPPGHGAGRAASPEVIAVDRDNGGDAAEAARYLEIPLGLIQARRLPTTAPTPTKSTRTSTPCEQADSGGRTLPSSPLAGR